MNVTDVEHRLRETYAATADLQLDHERQPQHSVPDRVVVVMGSRPRSQRRTTFAAVCAAAAAVIVVVAGAAALAGRSDRSAEPATVWNTTPPSYATQYMFGPSSMPGLELNFAELTPSLQRYQFDTPNEPNDYLAFGLYIVTPTPAIKTQLDRLSPVKVGTVTGGYGIGPVTGPGVAQSIFEPAPATKYEGTSVPDVSVVAWPLDGNRWAVLSPQYVHGDSSGAMSESDLVRRAATVVPDVDDHVTPVKIGYLPAGLRFAAATAEPITHSVADPPPPVVTLPYDSNAKSQADGTNGKSARVLSFTAGALPDPQPYETTLNISVVSDPFTTLSATKPNPMVGSDIFSGPWRQTTVEGHFAWVSPHDVLIQWGDLQIGVSSSRYGGHATSPLLSQQELLKVADSLTVPNNVSFGHGFPLLTSVPAGSLS
jgi:hypothetical protein